MNGTQSAVLLRNLPDLRGGISLVNSSDIQEHVSNLCSSVLSLEPSSKQ